MQHQDLGKGTGDGGGDLGILPSLMLPSAPWEEELRALDLLCGYRYNVLTCFLTRLFSSLVFPPSLIFSSGFAVLGGLYSR